ncbi:hypothetical protein J8273_4439 [Carpediemonas membranifera]|uniref:Uncharacterized protein n=1 Tax=Carpediemonas membranifera TaxID=201153 RepID=A0A8J6E2A2_9EUKA|nr:hypothetical protein J8273_4439 [Carpediemonas membranifera]|eukprot:KAG9394076.1 hypothetical protein J8273_4439 [Carpediemonas membranifera]
MDVLSGKASSPPQMPKLESLDLVIASQEPDVEQEIKQKEKEAKERQKALKKHQFDLKMKYAASQEQLEHTRQNLELCQVDYRAAGIEEPRVARANKVKNAKFIATMSTSTIHSTQMVVEKSAAPVRGRVVASRGIAGGAITPGLMMPPDM